MKFSVGIIGKPGIGAIPGCKVKMKMYSLTDRPIPLIFLKAVQNTHVGGKTKPCRLRIYHYKRKGRKDENSYFLFQIQFAGLKNEFISFNNTDYNSTAEFLMWAKHY